MALQSCRIGAVPNAVQWDDGDFTGAIETTQVIKAGAPVAANDVVILGSLPTIATIVTAAAVIADHSIVRGDGGARGVQGSIPTITDAGSILLPDGTLANPAIGFTSNIDCGLYFTAGGGGTIYAVINGVQNLELTAGEVNSRVWFRVITGTVGALSITFGNDVNTGFYSPGADQVGIATNGALRLHVSNTETRLGEAANHVSIGATGDMSFIGTATVWNDIYFPTGTGKIGGANQPTWGAFQGNTFEYLFAINDYINLPSGEILHSYKEGTDIELHCHIVLDGSDVGATYVNYEIEYTIGDIDEIMSAAVAVTSGDTIITAGLADRTHMRVIVGTITGTNLKSMAALKMRFRRIALVGGGLSDPSNDPFALMVGAHIEEDTVGSRTKDAK